ncbi:MAG: cation:proton antiporter, partial [Rhodobacteraceae bacterium]|nr:cation:proton antiporter [Paracoccaceae bacterium]
FGLLAAARAREVMTAAALLVVLGAALAMELGGLSTAMGAFLAGVLLSESSFRHQLEADVEPFRGILLGLFFLAVGMALDLSVIAANAGLVAISVAAFVTLKSLGIYAVARLLGSDRREALERAVLMAQGGEFAFVLYAAAASVGLIEAEANAVLTAIIIVSMALTPLAVMLHDRLARPPAPSLDGVDAADGLAATVLMIGFGRVGQIVSQPILARGHSVSIIDTDIEMIQTAGEFGFKVHYGDGARLDILHSAGAQTASAIVICVDDVKASLRIAEIVKAEFPLTPVLARAWDRGHALQLVHAGVDEQVRETFESALLLGEKTLAALGEEAEAIAETMDEVRRSDAERFALQLCGDIFSGSALIRLNIQRPATTRDEAAPRTSGGVSDSPKFG